MVCSGGHRRIKELIPAAQRRNQAVIDGIACDYERYIEEGRLREYLRAICYRLKVNTAERIDEEDEDEE